MFIFNKISLVVFLTVMASAEGSAQNTCQSQPGQAAIEYRVRGGLTGAVKEWAIYPNGIVCCSMKYKGKMTAASISRIQEEARKTGFFNLEKSYKDQDLAVKCYQCNFYRLTIHDGDLAMSVETHDGAKRTPPELWKIMSRVQHELQKLP